MLAQEEQTPEKENPIFKSMNFFQLFDSLKKLPTPNGE